MKSTLNSRDVIVFVVLFTVVCCQTFNGDVCKIKSTGKPGECKLFKDCLEARKNLQQKIYPQMCGFQGSQSIVCCPAQRKPGEISQKKCREYSRYVYKRTASPVLFIGASPITKNECGHKVVKLIIGGEPAGVKEFPHMAAIGFELTPGDLSWLCGGTILSNRYILTAAHCLSDPRYGNASYVRIGVTNLGTTSQKQDVKIAELIPHPDYRWPSFYNDIGLIKLEKPAKMNPYARPACLYTKDDISADRAIATGWGDTTTNGFSKSDQLLKVTLKFVDFDSCNDTYKNSISRKLSSGISQNFHICASSDTVKIKDTCMGDSGGPLQIYHIEHNVTCMYDILGITSFGKVCSGAPGVYVRVSYYIKWIEDIVWPVLV